MPQCEDAVLAACSNNVKPTSESVGTIVNGVIIFTNLPINPVYPINTWNNAETAIAPDNSLIRICHNSVFSSVDNCDNASLSGHFH